MKTNKTKDLIFFLLKEEKKHKDNKGLVEALAQARRDIAVFKEDEDDEGIYAFVWETYTQARIAYHDTQGKTALWARKVFAKLAERLEQ